MADFGAHSQAELATCDERLQTLFKAVNEQRQCTIIEGRRSQEDQDRDFAKGVSKLQWPHGKHNTLNPDDPCKACDVKPDDLDWNAPPEDWKAFADLVLSIAAQQGTPIRWGGAWNGTYPNLPGELDDFDHFELHES